MTSLGESCAVSRYRILHSFYTRRPNIEWLPTHIEYPRFEQIAYEANSDTVFPTDKSQLVHVTHIGIYLKLLMHVL